MKILLYGVFINLICLLLPDNLMSRQGGKFVFAQLRYNGNWDTRETAWDRMSEYLFTTTSVKAFSERQVLQLKDEALAWSPFLVICGDGDYPVFSEEEYNVLRKYVYSGAELKIATRKRSLNN